MILKDSLRGNGAPSISPLTPKGTRENPEEKPQVWRCKLCFPVFSLINPLIDSFSECLQLAAFRAMGSTDGSAAAFLVRSRWQTSGFQFGTCMYE